MQGTLNINLNWCRTNSTGDHPGLCCAGWLLPWPAPNGRISTIETIWKPCLWQMLSMTGLVGCPPSNTLVGPNLGKSWIQQQMDVYFGFHQVNGFKKSHSFSDHSMSIELSQTICWLSNVVTTVFVIRGSNSKAPALLNPSSGLGATTGFDGILQCLQHST